MNNPIKERIDAELPPGGRPLGLDAEGVLRASRSRRMKRRLAGAGAALASIVTVAAVVLSVMTLAPDRGDGEPDDAATKTEADDPVLDPGKDYYWEFANGPEYKNEVTDASREYTNAFWKYLAENHPEAIFIDSNGEGTDDREEFTGDPAEDGFFGTRTELLYEGDKIDHLDDPENLPEPVRERTGLAMYERFEPGKGFDGTGCCGLEFMFDGEDSTVSLNVEVLAAGSYTKGTEDAMDPAWCLQGPGRPIECDTDMWTGGDGDEAWETTSKTEGEKYPFGRSTVLYREDGSAVVVEMRDGSEGTEPITDRFDLDDLLGIALTLPDTPID